MYRNLIIIACFMLLPLPAIAIEITPMAGYRFGGQVETVTGEKLHFSEDSSFALAVDFDLAAEKQIELFWSHQKSDLTRGTTEVFSSGIDYIHIGGTVLYPQQSFSPFVAGGLGVTHFSPDNGYKSETRFSISIGGGIKKMLTDHIGLRLEGRGYGTWFPNAGAIFCGNGGCNISASGDALFQFEGLAGAILKF